jgi:hypothetical protein
MELVPVVVTSVKIELNVLDVESCNWYDVALAAALQLASVVVSTERPVGAIIETVAGVAIIVVKLQTFE